MPDEPQNLEQLVDRVEDKSRRGDEVALRDAVESLGRRSFGPLLLLPGLVTLSPLIGDIPGMPTLMGVFVILVCGQLVLGYQQFWLPNWLLARSVSSERLRKVVRVLRRPARAVDHVLKPRLCVLAGATSLPDLAATLSAAVDGRASLAMSNVMGSMAANLVFLGVGDLVYRKANLEHATASAPNLMQAALLIGLLTIPLIASTTPAVAFLGVHPATPLLVAACLFGIHLVRHSHEAPMWRPRQTAETVVDRPEKAPRGETLARLWAGFGALALVFA